MEQLPVHYYKKKKKVIQHDRNSADKQVAAKHSYATFHSLLSATSCIGHRFFLHIHRRNNKITAASDNTFLLTFKILILDKKGILTTTTKQNK